MKRDMLKVYKSILSVLGVTFCSLVHAEPKLALNDAILEEIFVIGNKQDIQTLSGSAHLVDEATLEEFDFSDLNQVLSTLPGVYIRQEDGYGLRPNIGLRGVTSERSQKITLMEDDVLIKPAPYSAPAAYYIPNISRMQAVEVVKGPASIKQGPNNVGGAINLVTKAIPSEREAFVDIAQGSYGYEKYQAFYSDNLGDFGYWVDVLRYGSDGFKDLDNGDETGFVRNDINAKLQWHFSELFGFEQYVTAKLGYADEEADETYLGLTEQDFDEDPNRRYAASQLDKFESEHQQVHLEHLLLLSDDFKLSTKLYWNAFERDWNKLDGFFGVPVSVVLQRPDIFTRESALLRGEVDSDGTPAETFDVTSNDRQYGSSGIQLKTTYSFSHGDFLHELESGIRFHSDYIERDHLTRGYLMVDGSLQNDGNEYGNKTLNEAETDAVALYVNDEVEWHNWKFNAGVRYESIKSESTDFLENSESELSQSFLAPGVGAFYQLTSELGFLVGINKGFSPAGASATEGTEPEEAVNYEYGLRYSPGDNRFEAIGFFSDYKNLLGRCRASEVLCNDGEEFNGGNVEVAGVELFGEFFIPIESALDFPVNASYTYTESEFQTNFDSNFSQWDSVRVGDELPYLPEDVGRIQVGVRSANWDAYIAASYQGEMRDQAGQEDIDSVTHADAYTTVDISTSWYASSEWMLQLSVDNITDESAIVSWRPFGARPNKPRSVRARVKYSF